jgi:hypothetical protein
MILPCKLCFIWRCLGIFGWRMCHTAGINWSYKAGQAMLDPTCLTSDWTGRSNQCSCQLVGQAFPISPWLSVHTTTNQWSSDCKWYKYQGAFVLPYVACNQVMVMVPLVRQNWTERQVQLASKSISWTGLTNQWRTSLGICRGLQIQIWRIKRWNYIPLNTLVKNIRVWNSRSDSVASYRSKGKSSNHQLNMVGQVLPVNAGSAS